MSTTEPWLWGDRHGHVSCGATGCAPNCHGVWAKLNPSELAEWGALALSHRTTLRCRCGAVEYDPASRTVRERT